MISLFNQTLRAIGAGASFSHEFIQWLRAFVDEHNSAFGASCPTGSSMPYDGAIAPSGWLLRDGTIYNIADYPELGALLGSTWGGDGTTTFGVGDWRGRAIIGAGSGSGLTARSLGDSGGEETHALSAGELAAHTHGVGTLAAANESTHTHGAGTLANANESTHTHGAGSLAADLNGAHTHTLTQLTTGTAGAVNGFGPINASTSRTSVTATDDSSGAHTHTVSGTSAAGSAHTHTISGSSGAGSAHTHTLSGSTASAGSGDAHNNMQPWVAANWIIKT